MKTCTGCGVEYPATVEFFHRDNRIKRGLKPTCKKCHNREAHLYRLAHLGKTRKYAREYWRARREERNTGLRFDDELAKVDNEGKKLTTYRYIDLIEEMIETCDVPERGWHYESYYKIPKVKFLVACKTCTIRDYCPNSNGQCKDLPAVMKMG